MEHRAVATLGALLRWWGDELVRCIPAQLRQRFTARRAGLVLVLPDRGDAVLRIESARRVHTAMPLPLSDPGAAKGLVASVLQREGLLRALRAGRIGTTLRLPPRAASRAVVDLPLAARENLDEVLGYELDRHTPFRASQAFFTAKITAVDPARKRLTAELVVAPRSAVENALNVARSFGLEPQRVELADAAGGAASADLLRRDLRTQPIRRDRIAFALGGVVALLAVAAGSLPIIAAHQRADGFAQKFAEAKSSVAIAAKLRKELEDLRREDRFLVDRKRAAPGVLKLLLESTRVVPDDVWLTYWHLAGAEIRMSGTAVSASGLVDALERSRAFRETTFLSPVTKEGSDARERFTLSTRSADGRRGDAPEATPAPPAAPPGIFTPGRGPEMLGAPEK